MSGKIVKSSAATLLTSLLVAGSVCVSAGAAFAADPDCCAQYARLAVHEASVLSTLSCFGGYDGRWHRDYDRHYGWCLTVSRGEAASERDYRRMRLYECGYRG